MAKDNSSEILNTAKDLYLKADYESALETIREGRDDLDPGLFHYNLGSLHLKKNELGPARLHLEKAKKESFSFPMVYKNLEIVIAQPQVYDPTKSKDILEASTAKVLDTPVIFFFILAAVICSAGLLAVRKNLLKSIATASLVLVLGIVPLSTKMILDNLYSSAIVLKTVRVFEGPSQVFTDYGEIAEGSRVIIGESKADWYYIISPKAIQGWVPKADIAFY